MSGRGRIVGPKLSTSFSGFWSLTEQQQDGPSWNFFPIVASGGTESTITIDGAQYRIHAFTATGTFTVSSNPQNRQIEYMIQAGGGGGARYAGGGGGGGQVQSGETGAAVGTVSVGSYTITVGAGAASEVQGNDSSIAGIQSCLGGGRSVSNTGAFPGGSGGGSQYNYIGNRSGTAGPPRQGYDGAWGGGGSGVAASTGNSNGGNGRTTTIRGTTEYFGGGGGHSGYGTGLGAGNGGLGGGGNGGDGRQTAGGTNTGGGGGAAPNAPYGQPGGSGIVIIRYRTL